MPRTIVEYYSKQNSSQCGYCKGKRCSHSHGMHAYVMIPQDYQDLIDRGWRRSGSYCYKPNNKITCCPSYTIRCDVPEFKLSKSHKKILKRMNKFLTDGIKGKTDDGREESSSGQSKFGEGEEDYPAIQEHPDIPKKPKKEIDLTQLINTRIAAGGPEESHQKGEMVPESTEPSQSRVKESDTQWEETMSSHKKEKYFSLERKKAQLSISIDAIKENAKPKKNQKKTQCKYIEDPKSGESVPPRKKAKQIRLERRQAKLTAKGIPIDTMKENAKSNKNREKTLREYIEGVPENSRHKLRLKLVGVKSAEFNSTLRESFGLYTKYQTLVHNDPPEGVSDYLNFLVRSPLQLNLLGGTSCGFGSFHQQYWLDDKLIAVGVIDVLPSCVSSVYFFYDPEYSFLSLGTYGSLREINFTLQLYEELPSLKYYYMGFYIHSCPKMRYKGKLAPSYLLCPEAYTWHLLTDEIRTKLEQHKYSRFNENPNAKDKNEFTEQAINSILITVDGRSCIRYGDFSQLMVGDNLRDMLLEYGQLVGKICAHRMLYVK